MTVGEAVRELQVTAIIFAAGPIASRRCLRGSEPGWRRVRTREEIAAHHEAAHAAVALALGTVAWLATIVPVPGVNSGYVLLAQPADASDPWGGRKYTSDAAVVRETVRALSLTGRRPLEILRAIRREAAKLVEEHWPLIGDLAGELLKRKTLHRADVAAIIPPHVNRSCEIPDRQ